DGAQRLRHRCRQEDQADPGLPDDHRPQLRRGAARDRLAANDGEAQGRDSGQLEAGRGRDHRRFGLRRRCPEDLPAGLESAEAVHSHRAAAAGVMRIAARTAVDGALQRAAVVDQMSGTRTIHAMPLAVAMMAAGGAMNVGGADAELGRYLASECLTCHHGRWVRVSAMEGGQIRPLQRGWVDNGAIANLPTMQRRVRAPLPTLRSQIFSGFQMMKLSAFGIFTLGSVSAFITSFSPMILLSDRM